MEAQPLAPIMQLRAITWMSRGFKAGTAILGINVLLGFLFGAQWLNDHFMFPAGVIAAIVLWIGVPIAVLLMVSSRTRGLGGFVLLTCAYAYAAYIWLCTFLVALAIGRVVAFIGVLFLFVGTIPIALWKLGSTGQWSIFIEWAVSLVVCVVAGFIGVIASMSAIRRSV